MSKFAKRPSFKASFDSYKMSRAGQASDEWPWMLTSVACQLPGVFDLGLVANESQRWVLVIVGIGLATLIAVATLIFG